MGLLKAIHRWLTADRIRISPIAGEMLRLEVGQRVIMNDALWIIAERQPFGDGASVGVRYHLVVHEDGGSPTMIDASPFICDSRDVVMREQTETSLWIDCVL